MKTDFILEEAKLFLSDMQREKEMLRIVDPVRQQVITIEGKTDAEAECCCCWGREGRCENCTSLRALHKEGLSYKMEVKNGHTYLVVSRFLRIDGRHCVLECVNDVTGKLLTHEEDSRQTEHFISCNNRALVSDALTGAYDRRFWEEQIVPSLDDCHMNDVMVSMALLDIDDFKLVNDTYGHPAGDALLRDVFGFWRNKFDSRQRGAERLIIRFGGDELLILAFGMELEPFREKIQQCYKHMRKICYYRDKVEITFSLSFGISSTSELSADWDWDELLGKADQRMYKRKRIRA